jgi:chromosome segregation ATPase
MFKKVLIASLAVVVGLAVVAKTGLGSHIRLWLRDIRTSVAKKSSPDREIRRLRMEVERLEKEDAAYFDKVARQRLEVQKRDKELFGDPDKKTKGAKAELAELRNRLTNLRTLVKDVKDSEKSGERTVSYNGENFTLKQVNHQIDLDWTRYKPFKAQVESQEAYLTSLKTALAHNEEKLMGLQKTRQDMLTQLQTVENELNELRQAKSGRAALLDDSNYGKVQKDIDGLKHRLAVEKEKLKIKGAMGKGPIEQAEENRAKQDQRQKEMDAELGGATPKN